MQQRQHCVLTWMQLREPFHSLLAHKPATTIAKKPKGLEKDVTGSQEPESKKASVDKGGIDIYMLSSTGLVLFWTNRK